MNGVCLRILSGPHLGAAIELPPGLYLVGSAEEADLILAADETVAGRHLELLVREEPEGPQVTARPLEAPAALNGRNLPPEGRPVLPGEVLALGFTALAWRPAGEEWGPITLAPLELAGHFAPPPADPPPADSPAAESPAADEAADDTPWSGQAREPDPGTAEAAEEGRGGSPWVFRLGLLILFLLLGLLILGDWGEGLTRRGAADRLNALLAEKGLTGVLAEPEDGTLVLRGLAVDDRELALITGLVAAQPYPVKVEVRILADRLRAVQETMNAWGFFPEVRLGPDGRLEIAVYMRDALVEDRLFSLLDTDLRGLAQAARRVVYARDLRPVLEWELRRAGLGRIEPEFLDGRVTLALTPDSDERRRLSEALERVRKTLGVPVVFHLADGRTERPVWEEPPAPEEPLLPVLMPTLEPQKPPLDPPPDDPAAGPGLARLEVMSVTEGTMPFITLNDGQKFFIGGVLPNGATLVGLESGRLHMALGDKIIIQTLEDNQ